MKKVTGTSAKQVYHRLITSDILQLKNGKQCLVNRTESCPQASIHAKMSVALYMEVAHMSLSPNSQRTSLV